jgi:hypothetical protein
MIHNESKIKKLFQGQPKRRDNLKKNILKKNINSLKISDVFYKFEE